MEINRNKIQSIQYLRGLSALAVVFCHYGMGLIFYPKIASLFNFGQLGIYAFFVISGFVIVSSLNKINYKPPQIFRFIIRRSLRIDPPYILILILFVLLYTILNYVPSFAGKEFTFIPAQFFAHILYIIPITDFAFYDHVFWTLCIEFQFYLLIGTLYFISQNTTYNHLFIVVFTLSCFVPQISSFYSIFNYGAVFSAGIVLSQIYNKATVTNLSLLIFTICVSYIHSGLAVLITLLFSCFFILFVKFESKALYALGEISYSLYITHTFLMIILNGLFKRIFVVSSDNELILLLVKVVLAIAFAFIYYLIAEKPAIKLAKRFQKSKVQLPNILAGER